VSAQAFDLAGSLQLLELRLEKQPDVSLDYGRVGVRRKVRDGRGEIIV
jgi:hypothetical protein